MRLTKYIGLIFLITLLCACKRKTTVQVKAYNYALAEPIANANVVIVERKSGGGIFSADYSCREIANATTDANGECVFDKEKMRKREAFDYYAVINYAYGKGQSYPCGGKTSGFLNVGKTNEQFIHYESFDAYLKVQYNNLLNPAQPGDSIHVYMTSPKYSIPGEPYPFGGGGVFIASPYYGCNGFPFPSVFQTELEKTNAGKHVLRIYKKKLGVVTQSIDTVKIYPYETKVVEINW